MSINKIDKIDTSEEEDSNLIINTDDDFTLINEFRINIKKEKHVINQANLYSNKNINRYSESIKINNSYNDNDNKLVEQNKINNYYNLNNNDVNDINNLNPNDENIVSNYNDEKTIFSKIAEDLYINNLENLKQKNSILDFSKAKADNYNKLTTENYLFTCADRENSKNGKIINDFIKRKLKEEKIKKIGINLEKKGNNSEIDVYKSFSGDHKKLKANKKIRSPEKFCDDQKIFEKKHKNYINNLIKMHNDAIEQTLKDRPSINKQSEKLAKMNKNNKKDVYLKLYEDFNKKKSCGEENYRNKLLFENNLNSSNKKLDFDIILENSERLYKEHEKKKININEKELNKLKDIKNLSQISLVDKKSNNIISKKLINIYKNELSSIFNKNISDNFEMNFMNYLLFINKLGLIDKNFNNNLTKNINIKDKTINHLENSYFRYSNESIESNLILNSRNYSIRNVKIQNMKQYSNNNKITKSLGKKIYKTDMQLKLVKDSWKIITKNKIFNDEFIALSHNVLLFFLCLCGIYKGEINDFYFKKEFSFLLDDKSNLIVANLAKQIYRIFSPFRNSLINNMNEKFKTEKNLGKKNNVIKISKTFIKINNYNKNKLVTISNNKDNISLKTIKIDKNNNSRNGNKKEMQNQICKKNNTKKCLIHRIKYNNKYNTINNSNKSINNKSKKINNNIKESSNIFINNQKIKEYNNKYNLNSKNIKNKKTLEIEIKINEKENMKIEGVTSNIVDNKSF